MKKIGQGFWYDVKTKSARIEVIRPGTRGAERRRLTLRGISRDDAEAEWLAMRGEVARGIPRKPRTFDDFLCQYLEGYLATLRSERTRKVYRSAIDVHIRPFFGQLLLAGIRVSDINRFVAGMAAKTKLKALGKPGVVVQGEGHLSPFTINGSVRVLRVLLRHAYAVGAIDEVPRGKWPHRTEMPRDKAFRRDELLRFLATFDDEVAFREYLEKHRNLKPGSEIARYYFEEFRAFKPLFVIAADTGFRRGDVLALKWEACNLVAKTITIEMQKTRRTVVVPITDAIAGAIAEIRSRPLVSAEFVFVSARTGKRIDWSPVRRAFETALAIAEIVGRSFHSFRHGVAVRLIESGASTHVVKKMLGHTAIGTTERYTLDANHIDEVAQRLNATSVIGGNGLGRTNDEAPLLVSRL